MELDQSVVQPRIVTKADLVGPEKAGSVHDTVKPFVSLPSGMTEPIPVHSDFKVNAIFPVQKSIRFSDLPSLLKEYFIFNHCLWFTYGGMQVDPLVEFFTRDGESKKTVRVLHLDKQALFNVSKDDSFAYLGKMLFAVPRDRIRDLLFWMDGTTLAMNKKLTWVTRRQNLPILFGEPEMEYLQSGKYISLFGFQTADHLVGYGHHSYGRYIATSKANIDMKNVFAKAP